MPGTAVLVADGTLEDIEDVELGDLVWARDPKTGEVGARPVSELIEGSGLKELVDVEVDGETITATDEHPFWVDDEGRWVDAEDLQVGDLLLLADGTTTEVDGVWHHTQTLTVHNLTVEGIHTYHVAIGAADALVHNASCELPGELAAGRNADTGVHVYRGTADGEEVYTGITNDIARRSSQHGERFDELVQITEAPLTRGQARAVEEALIARAPLQNGRHEISPNHPWYDDAVAWGEEWLATVGRAP